ncbi:carboxypeptidase-like regulatory domain-containing protein [Puia sp. P3]|uniref:STN domain-containing protein n=1 Tax=Puia sp. P3 TaxID=3423952 RepID=UPI003D675541
MNKLVLYLLLACMALARDTYAQSITLSVNNASLDTVFARIQSQTPYRFVYTNEELVGTKRISLSVQKAPVETVLSVIFKDQPVDYSREEQYIYVQKKQENKSGNAFVDRAVGIRGKVGDSLGSPLAGASIQLRGAKRGIQTDANGAFQLTGLRAGDVIQVTFTGYLAREIKFTNQTYLNVVLIRSASPLDEIQIVAYGKTTQRTNTGSAVRVDGKTISDQPLDNPINALAGKVPGLFVQSGRGLPGTFTNVQLSRYWLGRGRHRSALHY